MKVTRYLCLLLAFFYGLSMQAQFNPSNPPEPGGYVKTYRLTVNKQPTNGGSVSGGGDYAPGRSAALSASPNSGFKFVGWYDA